MSVEQTIKIYRRESFYLDASTITEAAKNKLLKSFSYKFYNEAACKKCDQLPDRHTDVCDSCSAFIGARRTAKMKTVNEKEFVLIPRGGKERMIDLLQRRGYEDIKIISKTPQDVPFSRAIKFTGVLKDHQEESVRAILKYKSGCIKAPPRSGKTVLATAAVCRIGQKTLILGAQREWLLGFQETFVGSQTQSPLTNARKTQIKICQNLADFQNTDVCLSTFAKFMSKKGQLLLKQIKNLFHVVIVDEAHLTPALQTSRVLSEFNSHYRVFLTATPEKKIEDMVQLMHDMAGPIIYEAKVDRLRPRVALLPTPGEFKKVGMGQDAFGRLQVKLQNSKPRRTVILKDIIKMAKAGHLVLVPLTSVNAILEWTRQINEMTERPGFAMPYYGGLKKEMKDDIIQRARQYKCKVIVGNTKMISTGLNIPRASCLYETIISNNKANADQRFSRILTPMEGKPDPVIVFTLDDCEILKRCRKTEYWNVLKPRINPIVSKEDERRLMGWFASAFAKNGGYNNESISLRDGF